MSILILLSRLFTSQVTLDAGIAVAGLKSVVMTTLNGKDGACGLNEENKLRCTSSISATSEWGTTAQGNTPTFSMIDIDGYNICGVVEKGISCSKDWANPMWYPLKVPATQGIRQIQVSGENVCVLTVGNSLYCAVSQKKFELQYAGKLESFSMSGDQICVSKLTTGGILCSKTFLSSKPSWITLKGTGTKSS